ncbi:MAG: 50S ribosomal protein L10 [Patescibacteria group bacterium]
MPKTRAQKEESLQKIDNHFSRSKSVVITVNKGINAEQMVELRKKMVKNNCKYAVPKKTILRKILEKNKLVLPPDFSMDGAVNLVFSFDDEINGPKTIHDFAANVDKVEIIGGIYNGQFIPKPQVIELATMPSKEELYAKLVGSINSPISGFVNVLAGNIRGLVNVLNAIKDQKPAV